MLYLLLTYDYELFFNRSFASEEEVLIKPSYDIANALTKEGIPATFFIDTPSVIAYKKNGLELFPEQVKEQVHYFLSSNHDVQLHIHPIWYKTIYKDGEWFFDNDYYGLKSFSNINKIVRESKLCLDELAEGYFNYNCCAFRAGGFCYSPVQEVTDSLINNGIKIDSSVCKGMKMNTFSLEFDYTNSPSKANWFFDRNDILKESCDNEKLFEVPVGTYGKVPYKWILTHCMPRLVFPPRKGLSTPTVEKNKVSLFERIRRPFITPVLFSTDSLHANALLEIVRYYESKSEGTDNFISIIGHPKISSNVCVDNTVSFVRLVKQHCSKTVFITMKDVAHLENL